MDYNTSELSEYLVKNKSLIGKISNIEIWKYNLAILNQVFVLGLFFYYRNDLNYWYVFLIFLLIGYPFQYLNGLFKKAFADKYELRKYKKTSDYRSYTPKKLATISRFRKFSGKRHWIIMFGGLALYGALFLRDSIGSEYASTNLGLYVFFLSTVSVIDHYINIT